MRGSCGFHMLRFKLLAAAFVLLGGLAVMLLWNHLVPAVFGGHEVSYGQAVGLLVLSRILFGGFGRRGGPGMFWRHRFAERIGQMTPEEREKFFAGMHECCGSSCCGGDKPE